MEHKVDSVVEEELLHACLTEALTLFVVGVVGVVTACTEEE